MTMTHRERILAAARGQKTDKLAYAARIDLWYGYHKAHGTLPQKYQGWSLLDILRDQGVGIMYRGYSIVKEKYLDMEVIEKTEPPYIFTEYRTPIGIISKKEILDTSEGVLVKYEMEKLFKSVKDYPVIRYVFEHTIPADDFAAYDKMGRRWGRTGWWRQAPRSGRPSSG